MKLQTALETHLAEKVTIEYQAWVAELEAERFTHHRETRQQLLHRVMRELPEQPDQTRRRLWREEQEEHRRLSRLAASNSEKESSR